MESDDEDMKSFEAVISSLNDVVDKDDTAYIRVRDVVEEANYSSGYALLVAIPAALILLPTGMIPGVSSISAVAICFFAAHMVLGVQYPWLPKSVGKLKICKKRVKKELNRSMNFAGWIDRIFKPRIPSIFMRHTEKFVGGLCVVLALSVFPLEMIPWASTIPAALIFLLALSLLLEDGLILSTIAGLSLLAGGMVIYSVALA